MIALAMALGFAPAAQSQAEESEQMNAIEYQMVVQNYFTKEGLPMVSCWEDKPCLQHEDEGFRRGR